MTVRASDSLPHHWKYISEGGATIVFSYVGPPNPQFDGNVLRLRKATLSTTPGIQDDTDDPLIEFQQKCMERLIPSEHLPRLESVHLTRDWLDSMITFHDAERPAERRAKDQVDLARRKGVLATDLVGGDWLAIEIKPKWAFLPLPIHLSDATRDVKSQTCRFCMHSAMKSKMGEAVSLGYCPLDLFSGNKDRVQKALYNLWDAWSESNGTVNNLKVFVHGQKILPSQASLMLLNNFNAETSHSAIREAFTESLLPLLLETPVLRTIATLQRELDSLDIEGLSKLWRVVQSAHRQSFRIDDSSPPFPPIGVSSAYLTSTEPTITEWTKFVDVYLSSSAGLDYRNPAPVNLRFYLLAYLLSATFKDCSIIFRLDSLQPGPAKVKPGQVTVIDLDPKSMARLRKWEELDREIINAYIAGEGRKVCVDTR